MYVDCVDYGRSGDSQADHTDSMLVDYRWYVDGVDVDNGNNLLGSGDGHEDHTDGVDELTPNVDWLGTKSFH